MAGTFHVPFRRGRTGIEVLEDQYLRHVWTPFEETTTYSLEERRNFWAAQGLMGELDGIDARAHRVREGRQCDGHGHSLRRVWGTI